MLLTALQASSVRGIPRDWPDVAIGPKGLVAYGSNGVGKSSIVDAIEFGLTQQSSLFAENRAGVNWERASPHIHGGASEICLQINDGQTAHVTGPEVPKTKQPDHVREWLCDAEQSSFVLRRHMLLRFILVQPKDRYGLLEPFLNIGSYERIEMRLGSWIISIETERGVNTVFHNTIRQRLRNVFGIDSLFQVSAVVLFEKLNAKLGALNLVACTDHTSLEARKAEIEGELGGAATNERLAELGGLKNQALKLGVPGNLKPLVVQLHDALAALEKETAARTEEILTDLLVRGKAIIEAAGLETCPLCEQPIDRPGVLERLQERIDADARITAGRKLVHERTEALLDPAKHLSQAIHRLLDEWEAAVSKPLPDTYSEAKSILDDLIALLEGGTPKSDHLSDYPARLEASVASHDDIVTTLDDLIRQEGGGERRDGLNTAALMLQTLIDDGPRFDDLQRKLKALNRERRIIERLHGHAVAARKSAVQDVLVAVSGIANAFNAEIHPDENIGCSSLAVREAGEGSVNLSTKFYGKDEPPLLHYSESHLDTLGLCYFLAVRKHEAQMNPDFKVLVMDDVLHSVDADHRGRFATLLKREFADHQMVITTHDRHFYDRLRAALGAAGFTYLAITGWDIERGPLCSDPSTDLDRIMSEEQREAKSPEELSAAGGRFFEWVLKRVSERLDVAVTARFEAKHTIGDLWPPVCRKLRKHGGFNAAHPMLADELDRNSWVRNACGAHYDEAESPVTPNEVRAFAASLAALFNATFCQACGTFIAKQDNEDWRCNCGTVSYSRKQELGAASGLARQHNLATH